MKKLLILLALVLLSAGVLILTAASLRDTVATQNDRQRVTVYTDAPDRERNDSRDERDDTLASQDTLSDISTWTRQADGSMAFYPKAFTKLYVSTQLSEVEYTVADTFSITVSGADADKLRLSRENNVLKLKLDRKFNFDNADVKIRITGSGLNVIQLSGACRMTVSGTMNLNQYLQCEVLGASTLTLTDTVTAKKNINLEAAGASTIITGALITPRISAEAAGASRIDMSGINTPKLNAEAAGASSVSVSGTASQANLEAAGASNIDAQHLDCVKRNTETSGISHIK